MMEYWKSGIVGVESGRNRFIVFLPSKPVFHYSHTTVRRKAPGFLYDQYVTKIFPRKVRALQKNL
jgi:hypothetical protein